MKELSNDQSNFMMYASLALVVLVAVGILKIRNKKLLDKLTKGKYRKTQKNEIWHIIKEYLQLNGRKGEEIVYSFVSKRPVGSEMYRALKEGHIFREKILCQEKGVKYKTPIFPKRYQLQDYFEAMNPQTNTVIKQHRLSPKNKNKIINVEDDHTYVVLFQTKNQIDDWSVFEINVFPQTKKDVPPKIFINKTLNYSKEIAWMLPIQRRGIEEAMDKIAAQNRKNRRKQRFQSIIDFAKRKFRN